MAFRLAEDHWTNCRSLIERLGGYSPRIALRSDFEEGISRIFAGPEFVDSYNKAVAEVANAANAFEDALNRLAVVEHQRISMYDIISDDDCDYRARKSEKLANKIKLYQKELRYELDYWKLGGGHRPRGRPTDTTIVNLCILLMRIAKKEQWIFKDNRGRTLPALIELATLLADCARLAGLTFVRDRRAVGRAMSQAREQHETEERAAVQQYAALIAIAQS